MLEIMVCMRPADYRTFFALSGQAGYDQWECGYLKTYAHPALNPLCANGKTAFLMAKRDGKCVFRALTGRDEIYIGKTGRNAGYFSLFDGEKDEEAASFVLSEIMRMQIAWGSEEIIGPVSPDGSGFFHGLNEGWNEREACGILTGPPGGWKSKVIKNAGFAEMERDNAYLIPTPENNLYEEAAKKAMERFSVSIKRIAPGMFRERWKQSIGALSEEVTRVDLYRMLDRIAPVIQPEFSFLAMRGNEPLGYLLSLKGKEKCLRASTIFTKRTVWSPPVTTSLLSALIAALIENGVKEIEASVISEENMLSNQLVLALGGRLHRRYTRFSRKLL